MERPLRFIREKIVAKSTFTEQLFLALVFISLFAVSLSQPYRQQRCSNRLENALEHMRRRSAQVKSSRSLPPVSPYSIYHTLYGNHASQEDENDDFYYGGRNNYAKNSFRNKRQQLYGGLGERFASLLKPRHPHKLTVSRVEVEDLKVKMPSKPQARWVEIQACNFNRENSTLDTRLIFPDLTISGKVILQPTGGNCNMILRLRHAGIEFHTIPIGFDIATNEESRRIGAASVRTDSHFAEPGFISVFAHGCQGPTGIRLRQNNRRRFGGLESFAPEVEISEPQLVMGTKNSNRWARYQAPFDAGNIYRHHHSAETLQPDTEDSRDFYNPNEDNFYRRHFRYKRDTDPEKVAHDEFVFNDDILNDLIEPDARAFANMFSGHSELSSDLFDAIEDRDLVNDAFTNELEKLFSMGVRGLLTTYMQRALQPAIKETLMENMGYTLSYG